jgi:hypothetical protein
MGYKPLVSNRGPYSSRSGTSRKAITNSGALRIISDVATASLHSIETPVCTTANISVISSR